jgi:hypothetical protein
MMHDAKDLQLQLQMDSNVTDKKRGIRSIQSMNSRLSERERMTVIRFELFFLLTGIANSGLVQSAAA